MVFIYITNEKIKEGFRMAVETMKDSVCVSQIIEQKNENVIVEGDSIIPDIKPDILSAISTSGTVCVYKKEIMEGKIRIDGSIETYIMYLADDENNAVRSMSTNLDFTQMIDMDKARPDMELETNIVLKNIECRVINGRKVNTKAILEIGVKVSSNENLDVVREVGLNDVQTLTKNLNIHSLIGSGSTKVYAKDTVVIDHIDQLAEVMKVDIRLLNKDTKISYNKVLAKADMNVRILYLTEDNRINSVENIIPVMGFIDIPDIAEENICDVKYEIKNLLIKPNNAEEHSIYIEAELEVVCRVYQNQEINLIQDLYSPSRNLMFTKKQVKLMQAKETMQNTCNIRESRQIAELQGNQIYDVGVAVEILKQTLLNDRVLYEGELKLNFIYASSNHSGIDTKLVDVPFHFNVDCNGVSANANVDTVIEVGMQDFIVTGDDSVDIKVDLLFTTTLSKNADIHLIDDIREDESRQLNTYSMIIYFVKPGDTLWKIAKKFGSTVEEIARVNGIELVDKLNVAQQLFIPRYHG